MFWKYAANLQENTHAEVWFLFLDLEFSRFIPRYSIISKSRMNDRACYILMVLRFRGQTKINRSCHWRCSVKEWVFKNFTIFTGKHLCQSLFFNKVAGVFLNKVAVFYSIHYKFFTENEACLLLTFFICLQNQSSSIRSIKIN